MVATFVLVAGKVYLQQQTIENMEAQIVSLESLEGRVASLEETSSWPVVVERNGPDFVIGSPTLLAEHMVTMDDKLNSFMYATERDIHNNPVLTYWLAEAHAAIDGENDPLPFRTQEELWVLQKRTWDDPYLAFPYDVLYDKVPD